MTVRIVLKNSEAEDKRPTAGQLANGEIAVNLHEAGAFLSIKDTAGNVQQVGGVKVAQNSPANPVKGTFWLDSDNNTLFIFDGSAWRGVTGGGGGGGGSINLAGADGIDIDQAGSTYTIKVKPGPGISVANDKVEVDLVADANTVGLKMVGAGDAQKLAAQIATTSRLGAVKVDGTSINVANDGEISAIVPSPLTYQGSINPTNEGPGGNSDAIPTGSKGDAWTVSWVSNNTSAVLDTAPYNWRAAVDGADATTQATIGDLLIIKANDGSNADDWVLVKTGTVDTSATISVGDGQTNAFPPDPNKQGDVWYNTDDARTYVRIKDAGGQNEWVDISPQGNQMLWEEAGDIIEPVNSSHELKIDTLGTNSADGTRLVLSTAAGVLKGNVVGAGLQIQNGVLKVRESGANKVDLQFACNNGNVTTTAIQSGGNAVGAQRLA